MDTTEDDGELFAAVLNALRAAFIARPGTPYKHFMQALKAAGYKVVKDG